MDTTHNGGGAGPSVVPVARFGIRYAGHDIEVRLAAGDAAADRLDVVVDGREVDPAAIRARDRDVGFDTEDGVEIRLHVGGREIDRLARVRLRRPDGYWIDLEPREGPADGAAGPPVAD